MPDTISAQELGKLMNSAAPFALIDVREWGEFELAQILGARSLPRGSIETYLPYLVPTSDVTVVVMCDDGRRSSRAAATAESMGYTRARVLDGGLEAWKKSGGKCYGGWSLTGKDYGEKLLVEEEIAELSVAELHGRLAAGERVCILDSRPLAEYRTTHLPSARSAPTGIHGVPVGCSMSAGARPATRRTRARGAVDCIGPLLRLLNVQGSDMLGTL